MYLYLPTTYILVNNLGKFFCVYLIQLQWNKTIVEFCIKTEDVHANNLLYIIGYLQIICMHVLEYTSTSRHEIYRMSCVSP